MAHGNAARLRQHLPVDAADVSLQRLVLPVGASPPRARCTSACAGSIRRSSGGACASPASRTSTARPRCSSCWPGIRTRRGCPRPVRVATGGAPPTPAILERMAELGMDVTHLYGLTETFGPAVICEWRGEWSGARDRGAGAVEGAPGRGQRGLAASCAWSTRTASDVPDDGTALGEIALRGNNVMLGYYQDEIATRKAIPDGWFRTGDLGVMHADGYVEIRDRAKDIIVSGGENIASIEIERALCAHPAVMEAAVVAGPDPKWGEVPVAFVTLKDGAAATRGRSDRARPQPHGALQGAEAGRVRRAAEERDGEDPEVRAARAGANVDADQCSRVLGLWISHFRRTSTTTAGATAPSSPSTCCRSSRTRTRATTTRTCVSTCWRSCARRRRRPACGRRRCRRSAAGRDCRSSAWRRATRR